MFLFSSQATEAFMEHSQTFMVGLFCGKSYQLKVVNYFCKKAPPKKLGWVLNRAIANSVKKEAI